MRKYFADAWLFIALIDRRDAHHDQARRLARSVPDSAVMTHDAVLTEVLAYFAEDGAHLRGLAAEGVRHALRVYEVLPVERPLFRRGLDLYAARPDKEYSLVDCISMVVMQEHGIRHVLTNDHHFTQAGFVVVNQ